MEGLGGRKGFGALRARVWKRYNVGSGYANLIAF